MGVDDGKYQEIYQAVSSIPKGRVATYGQVARLAGLPGRARLVGHALGVLEEKSRVPWHRVVNAQGKISVRGDGAPGDEVQRLRLEAEGVEFDREGRLSLALYQWRPEGNL